MKKMMFAVVLALLCMLTAVPALAEERLDLESIESGSGEIGGGTYSYDAATKTLTLNNVNLTGEKFLLHENYGLDLLDTIVLNGENSIKATKQYAFKTYGDLTITGEGSLTVNAPFAPIFVFDGDLIIDGVDIAAQDSNDTSAAIQVQGEQIENSSDWDGKIEIRNGGSLSAKSYGEFTAIFCGNKGGISVAGGSSLVLESLNSNNNGLYNGTLTVSDTSSVEIRSGYRGLPERTEETAEAAILTAMDLRLNRNYGLSFNKGSEPYIFTVTQTAMEDGRNLVNIIGSEKSGSEGEGGSHSGGSMPGGSSEGTATPAPMPETGDESHPILWAAMLLTAAVWFATRKRANA